MIEKVAKILGNMAYEIEHCDYKDPIVGRKVKRATLQICQLKDAEIEKEKRIRKHVQEELSIALDEYAKLHNRLQALEKREGVK